MTNATAEEKAAFDVFDKARAKCRAKATRHTPGPWRFWHSGYANAPFVVYSGFQTGHDAPSVDAQGQLHMNNMTKICEVKHDESEEHDTQIANARLIAAAPELLEALEYLRGEMHAAAYGFAKINAAISKAKGGAA
jgi:hypothetical protein